MRTEEKRPVWRRKFPSGSVTPLDHSSCLGPTQRPGHPLAPVGTLSLKPAALWPQGGACRELVPLVFISLQGRGGQALGAWGLEGPPGRRPGG